MRIQKYDEDGDCLGRKASEMFSLLAIIRRGYLRAPQGSQNIIDPIETLMLQILQFVSFMSVLLHSNTHIPGKIEEISGHAKAPPPIFITIVSPLQSLIPIHHTRDLPS